MVLSKKQAITVFSCLLISLAAYNYTMHDPQDPKARLLSSSYTTTSTRTTSVNTYCHGLTRTTLVDSTLTSQYNVFSAQMSTMFSLNGYRPIYPERPSSPVSSVAIQNRPKPKRKTTPLSSFSSWVLS